MNKKFVIRVIKLSISLFYFITFQIIALICRLFNKKPHGTFVVLYYHEIKTIHKEKFSRQMNMLSRYAVPVKAESAVSYVKGEHRVAVTFDDAFQSIIENGRDAIVENKIPVTIFVPTAYLGRHPEWELYGNSEISKETIMTKEELANLPGNLFTLGSHTCTHPILTHLQEREIETELKKSKRDLENMLNEKVDLLAFPHGDFNNKVMKIASDAGYKYVFSIMPQFPYQKKESVLIGRTPANPFDWDIEFKLKIYGCYSWLPLPGYVKRSLKNLSGRKPI